MLLTNCQPPDYWMSCHEIWCRYFWSREQILLTLITLWLFFQRQHEVHICGFEQNVSTIAAVSSARFIMADMYPNGGCCINESISSFIVRMELTGQGKTDSYLNWEGLSTTDSGSNRKCFWVILPVRVSIVTTGKPIWRVQRFMMSWTVWGMCIPGVFSTAWQQTDGGNN